MYVVQSSQELQLLQSFQPPSIKKEMSRIPCKFYHDYADGCIRRRSCSAFHTHVNQFLTNEQKTLLQVFYNNNKVAKFNLIQDNKFLSICIYQSEMDGGFAVWRVHLYNLSSKFDFVYDDIGDRGGINVGSKLLSNLQSQFDDIQRIRENIKFRLKMLQLRSGITNLTNSKIPIRSLCAGCNGGRLFWKDKINQKSKDRYCNIQCSFCHNQYRLVKPEVIKCQGTKCQSIEYEIPSFWIIFDSFNVVFNSSADSFIEYALSQSSIKI